MRKSSKGYLPKSDEAFEKKRAEWEERECPAWSAENLTFPFTVTRTEDEDDAYFSDAAMEPFRLGHKTEVVGLDDDNVDCGITLKVLEQRQPGCVRLSDLEVQPKTDNNYGPIREYMVWYANRAAMRLFSQRLSNREATEFKILEPTPLLFATPLLFFEKRRKRLGSHAF